MKDKISDQDWKTLVQMRQAYLGEKAETLWSSARSLELYDMFFGRRIADKWQTALNVFSDRDHAKAFHAWRAQLQARLQVWDWGCGTGRASRTFCETLGIRDAFEVVLTDKSTVVEDWALAALHKSTPAAEIKRIPSSQIVLNNLVLLLSHVINELDSGKVGSLADVAARAEWIFWVENGSKRTSRQLAQVRNKIRHTHDILAPCIGQTGCPAVETKEHTHWCHFFAQRSADYFSDANWAEFSKQLGIDLRSIPYSFFIARRKPGGEASTRLVDSTDAGAPEVGVQIGRGRVYKGYADTLICDRNTELQEWRYQKKSNTEIYREIKKEQTPFVLPAPVIRPKS